MRSALVLVLVCIGCASVPKIDPAKLERALRSMDKAASAVQDAIEDARAAAPLPEQDVPMESVPVQAEPLK